MNLININFLQRHLKECKTSKLSISQAMPAESILLLAGTDKQLNSMSNKTNGFKIS